MEVRQEVRLPIVNANRKQRNQLPCFGGRFEMSSSSFVNIVFLFYFSYRLQARIKTTPFQATGFEFIMCNGFYPSKYNISRVSMGSLLLPIIRR